jgi:hypothetical protein
VPETGANLTPRGAQPAPTRPILETTSGPGDASTSRGPATTSSEGSDPMNNTRPLARPIGWITFYRIPFRGRVLLVQKNNGATRTIMAPR